MRVLVTGSSRGLGRAIAAHLHESGHEVIGCSRSDVPDAPFRHVAGVDFADLATLDLLADVLPTCDGLVNNVGIAHDGLLATMGESRIAEVLHVNLTATLVLTKRYLRCRLRQGGAIVNVSSIIGIRGYAGLAVYSASKAGLDAATRALAREMGPRGFRVNSVLPGYMRTDMSAALDDPQLGQIVRRTPLGRLAEVADVAPVVAFLLGDAARFVTGQCLVVDGGITV